VSKNPNILPAGYIQNAVYFLVKKKGKPKRWIFLREKKGKTKTLDIFK